MTLEECAAGGPEQGLEEGMQDDADRDFARSVMQDINLCVVQGKREQLRLQAEARFGTPAGQRLHTWLRLEDDRNGWTRSPCCWCAAKRPTSCSTIWWLTPVPIPLATARPPSAAKRLPKPAA